MRNLQADLDDIEEDDGPVIALLMRPKKGWPPIPAGKLIAPADIPDDVLLRPYYEGFGGDDVPDCTFWTAARVWSFDVYDGATHLFSLPRDPTAEFAPFKPGGGGLTS